MATVDPTDPQINLMATNPFYQLFQSGVTPEQMNALMEGYFISTLSSSESTGTAIQFYASSPNLAGFKLNGPYDNLYSDYGKEEVEGIKLYMENKKSEIISQILDAWSENVSKINIMLREAAKKEAIDKDNQAYQREQESIAKEQAERRVQDPMSFRGQIFDAGHFQDYLRDLPLHLRDVAISAVNSSRDPSIQNSDLAKAVMPVVALEVAIIVPAAQAMVMGPVESLSSQIAVNPISDRTVLDISHFQQLQTEMIPLINFFALDMVKDVTILLYAKSLVEGNKGVGDLEFAREFANQVLAKVSSPGYIENELLKHVDNFGQLPLDQKEAAVMITKMFLLVNVLMLFTDVEGGSLSPQELKEMLLEGKGMPETGKRAEVSVTLNEVILSVPEELRGEFVETMLAYVDSMPDRESMTSFTRALNAATEEFALPERAV